MRRSELRVGLALLAGLALAATAAPWIAPHRPELPLDPVAGRYLPPASRRLAVSRLEGGPLLAERVAPGAGGAVRVWRNGGWQELPAATVAGTPSRVSFPLGTDRYGRDLLSRLLHGGRISLLVGLLAAGVALLLGTTVGMTAAMTGRGVDALLMRAADALLAFPRLFLVLAAAAFWRGGGTTLVVLALGLTGWMEVARVVRAETLTLEGQEFVLAARTAGVPPLRLAVRHLLPHVLPPVLVLAALRVGDAILAEAALSYLGFGIQPPRPSWGNLIAEGQDALVAAWWVSLFPGLAITLAVFACNLVADGIAERVGGRAGVSAAPASGTPDSSR